MPAVHAEQSEILFSSGALHTVSETGCLLSCPKHAIPQTPTATRKAGTTFQIRCRTIQSHRNRLGTSTTSSISKASVSISALRASYSSIFRARNVVVMAAFSASPLRVKI